MPNVTVTDEQLVYLQRALERDLDDLRDLIAFGESDLSSEFAMCETVLRELLRVEQTQAIPF